MDLSADARCVVKVIEDLEDLSNAASFETILANVDWIRLHRSEADLSAALDSLVERQWIRWSGQDFQLTDLGREQAKRVRSEDFDVWLAGFDDSAAYRRFCQQVYGLDLCQANMMSQRQLDLVMNALAIGPGDRVLDLGCGVGLISEYVASTTGATVVGVDLAAGAVARAQRRSHPRLPRLSFRVMDMDHLELADSEFSAVLAIDTLYFAKDLTTTLRALKHGLKSHGRLGILYTVKATTEFERQVLAAEATPLAVALKKCDLNCEALDLTADERDVWERSLRVAEALKAQFMAEGHTAIYEETVAEALATLELFQAGRIRRYLYIVR